MDTDLCIVHNFQVSQTVVLLLAFKIIKKIILYSQALKNKLDKGIYEI